MLDACRWLALEVKYLDPIVSFYTTSLSTPVIAESDREIAVSVGGEAEIRLRRPDGVPRGGLHTHYALSCPADAYDLWRDQLSAKFDLQEVDFGSMRSLYLYDPVGNCVEIGGADDVQRLDDPTLSGIFEVVFEVESLPDAEDFYTDLGFEIVDRGDDRRRTRLTTGPFDIELWEPHLGLADARGGVHVDVGIGSGDPAATADAVADRTTKREPVEGGVRIRDPDGHYLTFVDDL
ncbi:MAG: VOC family protein [Natronomonas sp.]|uniref:VOC family protein n=1 Tax=Natronomonas sp. TaxID=2184060 RepID=UPI00286FFBBF|nr:VOC family protein [Natronomonas sp.]MDR9430994.1 VOC family protein [Natronomonas sp.]